MERISPVVKYILIINVLVFILQIYLENMGSNLAAYGMLWGIQSGNFGVWQLVTHMFMHGDFRHIFFNMFVLYMFGSRLEYTLDSKRFLQLYVTSGLAAGILQMLISPYIPSLGASGAVMGVMAAFAYLFPNSRLMIFPIFIPIKAKYAIGAMIAIDLFSGISGRPDNIAHWAHLGGAAAGLAIIWYWNKTNRKKFY